VVDSEFNVSQAVRSLNTSQPGVSKQIGLLEQELGIQISGSEAGNRVVALTRAGEEVLAVSRRILIEIENLTLIGRDGAGETAGKSCLPPPMCRRAICFCR